ncbi:MAG: hypothetical protein ABJB74_01940 [Gemmatimonas sp.]
MYRARDLRDNRKVGLRVPDPDHGAALGAERLLKEIVVTARLQLPKPPPFNSGNANGLQYYVMSFVERETLRAQRDRERQLRQRTGGGP